MRTKVGFMEKKRSRRVSVWVAGHLAGKLHCTEKVFVFEKVLPTGRDRKSKGLNFNRETIGQVLS